MFPAGFVEARLAVSVPSMRGTNDYNFFTRWRVSGRIETVAAILEDAASLPRWWPSVYLEADVQHPGDARGVGKRVRVPRSSAAAEGRAPGRAAGGRPRH